MIDRSQEFIELIQRIDYNVGQRYMQEREPKTKSEFTLSSLQVVKELCDIKTVIRDAVEAYSDISGLGGHQLSEEERDAFDAKVSYVLKVQTEKVVALKNSVESALMDGRIRLGDQFSHQEVVLENLNKLLQETKGLSGELQLLRMRHTLSTKKALYVEHQDESEKQKIERIKQQAREQRWKSRSASEEEKGQESSSFGLRNRRMPQTTTTTTTTKTINGLDDDAASDYDDEDTIDQELLQAFDTEQDALKRKYMDEELESLKKAEQQITEVSNLLTLMHNELEKQSYIIGQVEQDVVKSTDYMDRASDQLTQAKDTDSTFRRNVIIFFAVATLLLLILDKMD